MHTSYLGFTMNVSKQNLTARTVHLILFTCQQPSNWFVTNRCLVFLPWGFVRSHVPVCGTLFVNFFGIIFLLLYYPQSRKWNFPESKALDRGICERTRNFLYRYLFWKQFSCNKRNPKLIRKEVPKKFRKETRKARKIIGNHFSHPFFCIKAQ